MNTPLSEHIARLEMRVQTLTEDVMRNRLTQEERNRVEAEIRAANLAIAHYRAAFEIENNLQDSN